MIRFRPPLRMNQVEDIIERSIFGTGSGDLLKVHQAPADNEFVGLCFTFLQWLIVNRGFEIFQKFGQ